MRLRLVTLKGALTHLAAPAEEQIRYLNDLFGSEAVAYGNDELALELTDAISSHHDLRERGLLSDTQIAAVQAVDQMLVGLSKRGNEGFWKRDALLTDPRWEQVRLAAHAALATL